MDLHCKICADFITPAVDVRFWNGEVISLCHFHADLPDADWNQPQTGDTTMTDTQDLGNCQICAKEIPATEQVSDGVETLNLCAKHAEETRGNLVMSGKIYTAPASKELTEDTIFGDESE